MFQKRLRLAFCLLSVILPVVFFAPFHHHGNVSRADDSCEECTRHQPHPGHLTDRYDTDDCLICQFLAQQYTPSAVSDGSLLPSDSFTIVRTFSGALIPRSTSPSSPRAPPVTFCL